MDEPGAPARDGGSRPPKQKVSIVITEGAPGKRTPKRPTRKSARIPSGTVTFLFTDIEGSTAMWEDYPTQMQDALARHDDILRGAVESHEGYVFKMIGDACCAVFGDAREALEATLAAQRARFLSRYAPELGTSSLLGKDDNV